ncbi:hypothetical protein HIM_07005 [Hirsutella minnesotensis 3608]|uniref:Alpha 1,4-glycosyltransferase domain-containing protein n=1 Tax=Hirsutella minnesotensis 3608 TaxID=1043627 RepID=A0A0F7ZZ63_9HYPO|nr:hypothetical protein HIM_07005 [Hirsutella minnesotensis 3608]
MGVLVTAKQRRRRLLPIIVGFFCFSLAFAFIVDNGFRERALNFVRPSWFYVSGLTRYNFRPSPLERACFDGTVKRLNAPNVTVSIPRVVHFITGIDRPNPINLITWLAVRAAAANLGPDAEIRLHYIHLSEEGPWWSDVKDRVTLVHHEPDFLRNFSHIKPPPEEWHPAHKADILRLQILRSEGGIYLDTDVILLRPLDTLLKGRRDVIMGYEGGNRAGMCNAVIMAKSRAPFLDRWYGMYQNFDPNDWNHHSVILPRKLAAIHVDDICPLAPTAFFWPMWTDDQVAWMHKPLGRSEALEVAKDIRRYGALFPRQLAYHATGAEKHFRARDTEDILRQDTRFNMLVRQYIDED